MAEDIVGQIITVRPVIAAKIFLFLDNSEIFLACSLVCRRWNGFLNSSFLWEQLMIAECGYQNALAVSSKTPDAASLFRDWVRDEPFFRPGQFIDLQAGKLVNLPFANCVSTNDSSTNASSLLSQIAATYPPEGTTKHGQAFSIHGDKQSENLHLVVNLERLLSFSRTNEQPIGTMPTMQLVLSTPSCIRVYGKLVLADGDFKEIDHQQQYRLMACPKNNVLIRLLPMGTLFYPPFNCRYLVISFAKIILNSVKAVHFRMLMPSHLRRIERFTDMVTRFVYYRDNGSLETMRQILSSDRKLLSMICPFTKMTLLQLFCTRQFFNKAGCAALLDEGADINQINTETYTTALTEAIGACRLAAVSFLIERGVDVNASLTDPRYNFVTTPLYHAITMNGDNDNIEIPPNCQCRAAKMLIEAGASVNALVGNANHPMPLLTYAVGNVYNLLVQNGVPNRNRLGNRNRLN